LKSAAGVEGVAVGVFGGQQLGLLVPWMNSPRLSEPPGAVAPSLVHRIVGNASGVQLELSRDWIGWRAWAQMRGRVGKGEVWALNRD
jgi:hypothetical protein